jgi:large subunit ribosomal protein L24
MHVTKNDTVMIIAGEDRGKTGKVLKVLPETRRVIVEKVNFVKRHTRPTQRTTQGGIREKEAPIHVSNVQLVCPKCGKAVRVGARRLEDGTLERYCKSCDEAVPRAGR